ncbi:ATP-dependent Clp protease proteolytic subunit-related protein 2, chloroplastic-like protein [Tanacetum coccineum]
MFRIGIKPARGRITMMPIGTPRVPYRVPGEGTWQWVDLWNTLDRERVIFIGQNIDEEFSNHILATMLYLDTMNQHVETGRVRENFELPRRYLDEALKRHFHFLKDPDTGTWSCPRCTGACKCAMCLVKKKSGVELETELLKEKDHLEKNMKSIEARVPLWRLNTCH